MSEREKAKQLIEVSVSRQDSYKLPSAVAPDNSPASPVKAAGLFEEPERNLVVQKVEEAQDIKQAQEQLVSEDSYGFWGDKNSSLRSSVVQSNI